MAELRYFADDRDRRHGQPTRLAYDTISEAVRAADAMRPPASVESIRTDAGAVVPQAYWELTDRGADPDRVLTHSWNADGVTGWRQAIINQNGAQEFSLSVAGRRGRITASADASANHRTWWLRDGTRWPDSEITSVWWGPSTFTTARPQMGHVHGAYVGEDGRLRAAVVWYNIVGGPNPDGLLMNIWEADGTNLWQGVQTTGGAREAVDRAGRVLWANRFVFGTTFTDISVSPHWAADNIVVGSTGVLSGMAATGMDGSFSVQGGSQGGGIFRLNTTGDALTDPIAGGVWTPDFPWRVFPYVVRSRYVPPVLMVKQWAYGRPEPDWGGPHVWSATMALDADTLELPHLPGLQGVVSAHAHTGTFMEYGDVTMSRAFAQAA